MANQFRYFIYARKSTESDDRQVLSINAQLIEAKSMVESRGLRVIHIFKEQKSAKATGRPVFNEMLARIEKGEADGIIAWHPDRLARNMADSGKVIDFLDRGIIKDLRFNQYGFENTPEGKLMLTIMMGHAKYYSDNLGENVKRGNRMKLSQGWLPGMAPLGYLNKLDDHTIIQDPEKAPLIRRVFDQALLGIPPRQILATANDQWRLRSRGGLPLPESTIYKILQNPFYAGIIQRKGERYPGSHKRIVTWDEFLRVKEMLTKRATPHTAAYEFTYTGLMRCSCGRMITAERKVSKGKIYRYYHCTWSRKNGEKCNQPVITEDGLETQIMEKFNSVKLPDPLAEWIKKWLIMQHSDESQSRQKDLERLQQEYVGVQKHQDRLLDVFIKGLITEEEYQRRKQEKEDELLLLKEKIDGFEHRVKQWEESMIEALDFSSLPLGRGVDPITSKMLLRKIASKLILSDKKLENKQPRSKLRGIHELETQLLLVKKLVVPFLPLLFNIGSNRGFVTI